MMLAVDVHYDESVVVAAGVGFEGWKAATANREWVISFEEEAAPYRPGRFYERELPYLLAVVEVAQAEAEIEAIAVDGHTWLGAGQPGLGARLYGSVRGEVAVVGVAKSAYHDGVAIPVRRGRSLRPLYVSAAGLDQTEASRLVAEMHGAGRIPTLLRRVDRLARNGVVSSETGVQ